MNWLKENWFKLVVSIIITLVIGVFLFIENETKINTHEVSNDKDMEESSIPNDSLSDEQIMNQLDDTLSILLTHHYVSISDSTTENSDTLILDIMKEAMDDRNKLQNLLIKTEPLSKSRNEVIATTGLVLHVSTLELVQIYNTWIDYLRGVDLENVNLSESQYQIALFQSSTHDIYLKLIEDASLLPMVTVNFAEDGKEENIVNENLKNHFISKIDMQLRFLCKVIKIFLQDKLISDIRAI